MMFAGGISTKKQITARIPATEELDRPLDRPLANKDQHKAARKPEDSSSDKRSPPAWA